MTLPKLEEDVVKLNEDPDASIIVPETSVNQTIIETEVENLVLKTPT